MTDPHWATFAQAGPLPADVVREELKAMADHLNRAWESCKDDPTTILGVVLDDCDVRRWARVMYSALEMLKR